MKKILIVSILIIFSGCLSIDRVKIRAKLLKEHVMTGQIIPGTNSFEGVVKSSEIKHKPGVYEIKSQQDYDFYFNLQKNVKTKPADIKFSERQCFLAITGAAEYTNIEFYDLIDGTDGAYHAYFVVNRKPVENADETRAFCLVDIPKITGDLKIEYIYLKKDLYSGYVVEDSSVQKIFSFHK